MEENVPASKGKVDKEDCSPVPGSSNPRKRGPYRKWVLEEPSKISLQEEYGSIVSITQLRFIPQALGTGTRGNNDFFKYFC